MSKDSDFDFLKRNLEQFPELREAFFNPKKQKLFCISAQQRNQRANMNKYYSNQKMKDFFYFKNQIN